MASVTQRDLEEYSFYRLYSIDLEASRQALAMLRRYRRRDVRYAVLRDAVLAYARPFSANRGRVLRTHSLPDHIVPRALRPLHAELIGLRNRVFAHTDHDFRRPRVARWPQRSGARYVMGFSNPDYDALDQRVGLLLLLVASVERAVNEWITRREAEFDATHA